MKHIAECSTLGDYLQVVGTYGGAPNKWKFYFEYIFEGVDFSDKTMLDIGGGIGRFSYYAAYMGAQRVICLEPFVEGSDTQMTESARTFQSSLRPPGTVIHKKCTFQEFASGGDMFDIILLHNSINHLDERACTVLHNDNKCREIYSTIFHKLTTLARPAAKLIIADCSRYNFFGAVGIKNPFAPDIEWEKHQSPEVWTQMLSDCGFRNAQIRWSAPSKLRSVGRTLFGNTACAYFYNSHFCLTMQKKM
jgi:SAM-dependent methyltransferase